MVRPGVKHRLGKVDLEGVTQSGAEDSRAYAHPLIRYLSAY